MEVPIYAPDSVTQDIGVYQFHLLDWEPFCRGNKFQSQDLVGSHKATSRIKTESPIKTESSIKTESPVPILLLHGFMGCAGDWQILINEWFGVSNTLRFDSLSTHYQSNTGAGQAHSHKTKLWKRFISTHQPKKGDSVNNHFHFIALDLPGHGKTDVKGADECYQMPEVASGIIQLLDQMSIERCHLVGYSMGGRLALYLALSYPHKFRQIVIESASPGLKTEEERSTRREWDERLACKIETSNFKVFLDGWYQQPLFASLNQCSGFPDILERRSHNAPHKLGRSLRQMGTGQQPSLWNALRENTTPMMLIVGEHDFKYRRIADEMGKIHPNCTIEIVSSCGHMVHAECPQAFIYHLQNYLVL